MTPREPSRDVLPIPDRPYLGPNLYDAKDPDVIRRPWLVGWWIGRFRRRSTAQVNRRWAVNTIPRHGAGILLAR